MKSSFVNALYEALYQFLENNSGLDTEQAATALVGIFEVFFAKRDEF